MSTIASGSYHGIIYEKEDAWGELNVTPDMSKLRHTSAAINLTKDGFQSNEIRSDRMISDFRHGVIRAQGDIGFEFSYGEFDQLLAAALFGTWDGNVLKAGTTAQSFTIERQFTDVDKFLLFTGCTVGSMSLDIPSNAMVTGSMSFIGKNAEYKETTRDATPNASIANSPFDSFTGELKEGGSTIGIITSLSISLENGVEPAFVLGSNVALQNIIGRSNLTGTMTAYFQDLTMLNKFVNETESSIELTLSDGSNQYVIYIPRVKYTGGEVSVSGEGAITISLPFQALVGSATARKQVDTVTLSGTFAADDTVTLSGIATGDVVYTVVAGDIVGSGNDVATWSLIAAKLANAANAAAGSTADASNEDEVLTLTAKVAGTGFTLGAVAGTTGDGDVTDAQVITNATATNTNLQITRVPA